MRGGITKGKVVRLGAAVVMALPMVLAVACRGPGQDDSSDALRSAPAPVQEAYAYAVTHPEVLRYIACYCGCVSVGHTSNEDCFIDQVLPDGRVIYDPMGAG